ncbi:MAG: hypothetical protein SPI49_08140 [Eubacteriales bacterium]|nr:hypothetical protein [Eubacteriales bacterium]
MKKDEKINYVMEIAEVSRQSAIKALELYDWDFVKAIKNLNQNNNFEYDLNTNEVQQKVLEKLLKPSLVVYRQSEKLFSIPLILVLFFILFLSKLTFVVFIISFFFNYSYRVENFIANDSINDVLNNINDFFNGIKNYFLDRR